MFKKGFFYIALVLIFGVNTGCSSSSDSGEDLDISEIKEIETTGEFSEDEFFSADDGLDTEETELIDEVAGLDEEITEDVVGLEDELAEELEIDGSGDETEEVAALEGSDILDELDSDTFEEEGSVDSGEEITVTAADLGFEDDDEVGDLFGDGDSETTESTVASEDELDLDSDELDLDSEEDLFRDEDTASNSEGDGFLAESSVDSTEFTDNSGLGFDDAPASETLAEDVTIEDVDYSDEVAADDKSASELLNEDDVSIDDVDYSNTDTVASTPSNTKSFLPVKKMQTVPYSKKGVLVNSIYFVRSGDTLASIGNKIYGSGSAVDFRIVNPHLRPGSLKVGQKVYYNSPNRSQDRSRLLTYYEDVRMPAQTYSASAGENIRTISKNLLGHPRSWMEVWASNQQIQEKWTLSAPYRIRYWQGGQAPVPTLAKNTPTPAPVAKIEPEARQAVEVAVQEEEATSQASLDLDEPSDEVEEEMFDEPVLADEETLDEPDMELDEPAEVEVADVDEDLFDDVIEDEPVAAAETNTDEPGAGAEDPSLAGVDGRGIARNRGGFPAKSGGVLGSNMMRQGVLAGALILLLLVGFLVVRRRRQSQKAVEMESFDFGGETAIDDTQDKTQIDL